MIELRRRYKLDGGGYNLPLTYQEVTYLQGDGVGTYINTKQNINANSAVYCRLEYLEQASTNQSMGIWDNSGTSRFFFGLEAATGELFVGLGNKVIRSWIGMPVVGEILTFELDLYNRVCGRYGYKVDFDGTFNSLPSYLFFYLFAGNTQSFDAISGRVNYYAKVRIYETIFKENNIIVKHLIPCYRKLDNVAGMYDLVSGEFYTNAGTGEFIVGPDVN